MTEGTFGRGHEHSAWSRHLFRSLADGGTWGIPRSGLMFQKQGDRLVLTERMPHMPGMPVTEEQVREQQTSDFEAVSEWFGNAGIEVLDGSDSGGDLGDGWTDRH